MTRRYKDIMADRSARLPTDSAPHREVFENAYDIALQVLESKTRQASSTSVVSISRSLRHTRTTVTTASSCRYTIG